MLNKIQLNLLPVQKHYSKRAYSKCKYSKILSCHPSLIFLSCLPSKTIIASFVIIGKIDSSHPNHNSILKIFGNRTQEVRIRRYVELSMFVCCVGRTFWLVRNKGDVYPFKVLRICNCMSSKMTKYFKIFKNFNFFNIKKQIRLKQMQKLLKIAHCQSISTLVRFWLENESVNNFGGKKFLCLKGYRNPMRAVG